MEGYPKYPFEITHITLNQFTFFLVSNDATKIKRIIKMGRTQIGQKRIQNSQISPLIHHTKFH